MGAAPPCAAAVPRPSCRLTKQLREAVMKRIVIFVYGVLCYALSLVAFVYAVGLIGGVLAPTLLAVFALQHSGMARPAFKRWWTRIVPEAAERSTYVLLSSLAVGAFFAFW